MVSPLFFLLFEDSKTHTNSAKEGDQASKIVQRKQGVNLSLKP